MSATPIAVGETRSCTVEAAVFSNATGIAIEKGAVYSFSAAGTWIDAYIESGPEGYPISSAPWYGRPVLWAGQPFRRMKHAPYFALIGNVGSNAFEIGATLPRWTAPASGELMTFANDVSRAYGNNRGSVQLTVTRIA